MKNHEDYIYAIHLAERITTAYDLTDEEHDEIEFVLSELERYFGEDEEMDEYYMVEGLIEDLKAIIEGWAEELADAKAQKSWEMDMWRAE